jgi:dienelactone hydrolase
MNETGGNKSAPLRAVVSVPGAVLEGDLDLPPSPRGVVVFPHARGTARAAHDTALAGKLREAGLGTLLLELLTPEEQDLDARKAAFRFDSELISGRLALVTDWLAEQPATRGLPIGYFGGGNGGTAALLAAAQRPGVVGAVISHDGLDLAGRSLARVTAPTLLLVGSNDETLLNLNRNALERLGSADKQLVVVPVVTELFEEPGAVDEVARRAVAWFVVYLNSSAPAVLVEAPTST